MFSRPGTIDIEHWRGGRVVLLDFESRPVPRKRAGDWEDMLLCLAVDAEEQPGLSTVLLWPDEIAAWVGEGIFDDAWFVGAVSCWLGCGICFRNGPATYGWLQWPMRWAS